MASVDNHGYVKHAMVGLLIVTVVPSATLAESKFLSLRKVIPHFLYRGILLLRGQTRCDQGLHKNPPAGMAHVVRRMCRRRTLSWSSLGPGA